MKAGEEEFIQADLKERITMYQDLIRSEQQEIAEVNKAFWWLEITTSTQIEAAAKAIAEFDKTRR